MATQPIDYEALAKKHGVQLLASPAPTSVPGSAGQIDYGALAKKHGVTLEGTATPAPPAAESEPSVLGEIFGGIKDSVLAIPKTVAALSELVPGATDGRQLEKAKEMFVDPIADQQQKAQKEIDAGNPYGGMRSIVGSVPLVGPGIADRVDKIVDPKTRTRALASTVTELAAPKLIDAATKAPAFIEDLTKVDPKVAAVKIFKPSGADAGFTDHIEGVRDYIVKHGGREIKGNEDLLKAAPVAKAKLQDALGEWIKDAERKNVTVPTDPIVNATRDAISLDTTLETPDIKTAILKRAQDAYGNGVTRSVAQMRQLLKEKNAALDSFYDRATGKRIASVIDGTSEAIIKAQRDAIADSLYKALDPINEGAGPRELQAMTGHINGLLDNARWQRNAIIAEKPISKLGAIGNVVKGVTKGTSALFKGEAEGALGTLTHPVRGATDPLIERLFKGAKEPPPLPLPPNWEDLNFEQKYGPNGPNQGRYTPTPPIKVIRPEDVEFTPAPFKSAEAAARVFTESPPRATTARDAATTFQGGATRPVVPEAGLPENIARLLAGRKELAKALKLDLKTMSSQDIIALDKLIGEGYGSAQPRK